MRMTMPAQGRDADCPVACGDLTGGTGDLLTWAIDSHGPLVIIVLLGELDRPTAAQVEVQPPGHHELHLINLRPALADRHCQPVLRIQPGGQRLIVAAILRLRHPIDTKADMVLRQRRAR